MDQNRNNNYQHRQYYRAAAPRSITQQPVSKRPVYVVMVSMALAIGLLGFTGYQWFSNHLEAVPLVAAASLPAEPPKPAFIPDTPTLEVKINEVLAANPSMQISVSITDITANKSYSYGVGEPFLAASTAKLLTATLFLKEVERGTYRLDTPVGGQPASQQLQKMIELSDNTAWRAFNEVLGKPNLETYGKEIGLQRYSSIDNTMLSSDIALLVSKLYKGELLDKSNTQLILSYMKKANRAQYIPAVVPSGVNVYHKAGWLDDRVHDVAIIESGDNVFALAIYTKVNGVFDEAAGQKMSHDITAAAVAAFIPPIQ